MTDDRFVNALYGGPKPAADAVPDARSPAADVADLFYGKTPPAPAAQPEMFDRFAALKSDLLGRGGEALHDKFGVRATDREADARRFVETATGAGLNDNETIALHRAVVNALLTAPPSADAEVAAAVDARDVEVRQRLREELGEGEATAVIAKTAALIEANPSLKELLDSPALAVSAQPFLLLARHIAGR